MEPGRRIKNAVPLKKQKRCGSKDTKSVRNSPFAFSYGRRLTITCFSETPSFSDLARMANTERFSSIAISREFIPATANDRSLSSSASVQVGLPTRRRSIISPSPSADLLGPRGIPADLS
jgi:hypothetical protein